MKNQLIITLVSVIFFTATSCKKLINSDKTPDEENELITTVSLLFIDALNSDTLKFDWSQPGGPGSGIAIDTIVLKPNVNYIATISILDESKNPTFNVSGEIKSDANSHRFIYTPTNANLSIKILDFDTHTPPIELGLSFEAITLGVSQSIGNFNVVLKHYTESAPKTGGLANGSTDIEVDFPLVIE